MKRNTASPYIILGLLILVAAAIGVWLFGNQILAMFQVAGVSCAANHSCAVDVCGRMENAHNACMAASDCNNRWTTSEAHPQFIDCDESAGFVNETYSHCAPRENSWRVSSPSPTFTPSVPETPGYERYAQFSENEFVQAAPNPLSTFSIDVDTGSYTQTRRFLLERNRLPPRDSVRLEEFVNYFDYDYPGPSRGKGPVAMHCAMDDCPWAEGHKLVRIGVQAKRLAAEEMPPSNLTFLIDVSGSMSDANRLPLLVQGLKMLVEQMREEDTVSIVTYASGTEVRLSSASGREKGRIFGVLDSLRADGYTSGGDGLKLAYEEAKRNFRRGGNNRVILASDGDWNAGVTNHGELKRFVESKRDDGIFLSVFGFGMDNYQDQLMKMLADCGNGHYAFIDNIQEAKKVFLEEFSGTLFTVAKDVKIQVEFNPSKVAQYRLLGYECRMLKAKDFKDDKKDAGEMGAGHTVTAMYEIVPNGYAACDAGEVEPLKYQRRTVTGSDEIMTVKLRYKGAKSGDGLLGMVFGEKSDEFRLACTAEMMSAGAHDESFRFASAVAECAMLLGDSKFKGTANWDSLIERARGAIGTDDNGSRAEFVRMAETARRLSPVRSRRHERETAQAARLRGCFAEPEGDGFDPCAK